MPISRWGITEVLLSLFAAIMAIGLLYAPLGPTILLVLLLPAAVIYFFRDPHRPITPNSEVLLAPADGVIVEVEPLTNLPPFRTRLPSDLAFTPAWRVSIFLSLFDVHVNRLPADGELVHLERTPGECWDARNDDAYLQNVACNSLWRLDGDDLILVRQITGLVARRIVFAPLLGESHAQGDRIGLIKFGSRTELYFGPHWHPAVSIGDRVQGAITVLAKKNSPSTPDPSAPSSPTD